MGLSVVQSCLPLEVLLGVDCWLCFLGLVVAAVADLDPVVLLDGGVPLVPRAGAAPVEEVAIGFSVSTAAIVWSTLFGIRLCRKSISSRTIFELVKQNLRIFQLSYLLSLARSLFND